VKDYKNIFTQKIGSKNDNSSKASLSQLSLYGTFKKVLSRFIDCSHWKPGGYWQTGKMLIAATM
jgi:hypothetical protein